MELDSGFLIARKILSLDLETKDHEVEEGDLNQILADLPKQYPSKVYVSRVRLSYVLYILEIGATPF